jgi:hypothetical protein
MVCQQYGLAYDAALKSSDETFCVQHSVQAANRHLTVVHSSRCSKQSRQYNVAVLAVQRVYVRTATKRLYSCGTFEPPKQRISIL